jgi:hypothetical protein
MSAVEAAVQAWKQDNGDPIIKPVVLHVSAGDGEGRSRIAAAMQRLNVESELFLFNCCLVDGCPNSVVVPESSEVPGGYCRELYDLSSDMPPLMEDIGALLRGHVTPRMRQSASNLAQGYGFPGFMGYMGADILGEVFGATGLSVPTARFGWTRQVHVAVDGLSINSRRGFVLVRDKIGFRIFTQLCN